MYTLLLVLHVLVCLALIALVMIQRGKGSDIGAAFGSGASNTVFGSQGAGDFLTRATAWLAATFFVLSLLITKMTYHDSATVFQAPTGQAQSAPAAPTDVPVIPE